MRDDWLQRYSDSLPEGSRRKFTNMVQPFLKSLGDKEPDAAAVRTYIDRLRRPPRELSEGTIRLHWGAIRRMFAVNNIEWPFRRGDAPVVGERDQVRDAMLNEDVEKMIKLAIASESPDYAAYLCLSTVWGMRPAEMLEMRPEYLDYDNRTMFVQTAKGGRQRYHVIPEFALPLLQRYGFKYKISQTKLNIISWELREAIGLDRTSGRELSWYAIRRAAIAEAWAFLNHPEVHNFYRWRLSTTDMALRYADAPRRGREGTIYTVGVRDRQIDDKVYEMHPFPQIWRRELNGREQEAT